MSDVRRIVIDIEDDDDEEIVVEVPRDLRDEIAELAQDLGAALGNWSDAHGGSIALPKDKAIFSIYYYLVRAEREATEFVEAWDAAKP